MNIPKLMAMLNAKTVRFDIGSGGFDGLTPQDVLQGLSAIKNKLGYEVLCRRWWKDGSALNQTQLFDLLAKAVHGELETRAIQFETAMLELHIARENMIGCEGRMHDRMQFEIRRLEGRAEALRARRFPMHPQMHVEIRRAVVFEIERPNLCKLCGGNGNIVTESKLLVKCPACQGRHTLPVSDRQRAERIGREESVYRRTWRELYEFTYSTAIDAESDAVREFKEFFDGKREAA